MTRYDEIDYWDDRYTSDKEPFEWYQTYSGIRHFLAPKYLCPRALSIPSTDESLSPAIPEKQPFLHSNRVLIVGYGNSKLGEELLQDGFKQISNVDVDFLSVVIRQMQSHYNDQWYKEMHKRLREERKIKDGDSPKPKESTRKLSKPSPVKQSQEKKPIQNQMTISCHDITQQLEFADSSFDLIVCKGTFDAILCNQNAFDKVASMMSECHRVLDSEHGVMVVVTYGAPGDRLNCFDTALWKDIKSYTVPKPMVPGLVDVGDEHYVYILFKRA